MRVLLIEPDRILAQMYERALSAAGHQITTAVSAQSAVHTADQWQPDVVVLELQLPYHNGIEFLYEFRSYTEWLAIPIIINTFVPLSELAPAATLQAELGVRKLLYKPKTSLEALCSAVARLAPTTA